MINYTSRDLQRSILIALLACVTVLVPLQITATGPPPDSAPTPSADVPSPTPEASGDEPPPTVAPDAEASASPAPETTAEPSPTGPDAGHSPPPASDPPFAEETPAPTPADDPAGASPSPEPSPEPSVDPSPGASPTVSPTPAPAAPSMPFVVTFASIDAFAARADLLAAIGATETSAIASLSLATIDVPVDGAVDLLAALQASPLVSGVDVDRERQIEAAPDDTYYDDQWALPRIGWTTARESMSPTGSAVVAILDTGIDAAHPDLAGQLVDGTSFVDGTDVGTDPNGHGTWMAGIVAAATNNGVGVAGVGMDSVKVMPVTVIGADGTGRDSDIIAGIVYATEHGADVILMAFSSRGYSAALQQAVDYAWESDVVLVAAVGNDGAERATYPAGDAGVMGVSATDFDDSLWTQSNRGDAVFLGAPGASIMTTAPEGEYVSISGTSAAAAYVAGSAALVRAADQSASSGVVVGRLARSAAPAGTQDETGNGRLDLARALADTGTEEVQPAGVAGTADGGPFVGPYTDPTEAPPVGSYTIAAGSVGFDAASSTSSGTAGTTLSWSHTVANQPLRMLVVGVSAEYATNNLCQATGVTFNGVALTKITERVTTVANYICASLWYLIAPPVGTYTIAVTYQSSIITRTAGAISLYNVEQTAPDASNGAINDAGAASTSLTTLAANSAVVDVFASGQTPGDLAPAVGQISRWIRDAGSTHAGAMSTKSVATAGSTTMTWTQTGINRSSMVAAAFAPGDNTPPTLSPTVTEGTNPGLQYFNTGSDTLYYKPTASGTFTIQSGAADTGGSNLASVTFPGRSTYQEVVADSAASYWRLGETSGTNAADAMGAVAGTYAGTPTLNQTGALAGDSDKAVSFDGVDDRVEMGDVYDFAGTASFSVEVWFKKDVQEASTWARLVDKNNWNAPRNGWEIEIQPDSAGIDAGEIAFSRWSGGVADWSESTTITQIGTWYHFVGTYDGTNLRVYINGVLEATAASSLSMPGNSVPFRVGMSAAGGEWFDGTIDDVAVYSSALGATQIQEHYWARLYGAMPTGFTHSTIVRTATPWDSNTYTFDATNTTAPSAHTITALDGAANEGSAAITFVRDTTVPSGQTVALVGGPNYSTLSVPLSLSNGSDTQSGINATSGVVQRASATLTGGVCGSFGSYSTVTLSGGADTTVASGNCYRYVYYISDNVGNQSVVSTASADAKVSSDTTPPTLSPTVTEGTNPGLQYFNTGSDTLYYNPTGTGTFTIQSGAADTGGSNLASVTFPGRSTNQEILADNPASYWRLGETSGTTATDVKGVANGTYSGGVTLNQTGALPGDTDKAAAFDGVDDGVTAGDVYDFAGTAAFSVEFWAKKDVNPASDYPLFVNKDTGTSPRNGWNLALYPNTEGANAGKIAFERWAGGSGNGLLGTTVTQVGVWYHVAATYDGTTMRLYINGVLEGTAASSLSMPGNANQFYIGRSTGGNQFDGSIDDVAIYNTVLSQTQLQEHYWARLSAAMPTGFSTSSIVRTATPWDSNTYTFDATNTTAPSAHLITALDGGANQGTATVTFVRDTTAPTGQTVALSGGPYYNTLSVPLTLGNGTDSQSGINSSSGVVQRASATLTNGSCGAFGSYATVTLSGGADTTVVSGNCYRYTYRVSDNVGNQSAASAASADAKVDTSAPSATFSVPASGTTVQSTTNLNVTWTENDNGAIASRSLQRQVADIVTPGSCAGVSWANDGSADTNGSPRTVGGLTTDYHDNFVRTVAANSWGSADVGGSYSLTGTANSTFTVDGSYGNIVIGATSTRPKAALLSTSLTNVDARLKFRLDKVPTGAAVIVLLGGRVLSTTTGGYYAQAVFQTSGAIYGNFIRLANSGGAQTAITSAADTGLASYTANSWLNLRFSAIGTSPTALGLKVWYDGTAEPSAWTFTTTDSNSDQQQAGSPILGASTDSGVTNLNITVQYDYVSFTDGADAARCYRWQQTLTDGASNSSTTTSGAVLVDISPPSAPSLTYSALTNVVASGNVLRYLPGSAGGLTVTASSTDTESAIAIYGFPTLPTGWTISGSGASRSWTYTINPTAPSGNQNVSATNNAGLSATTAFTLVPDTRPVANANSYNVNEDATLAPNAATGVLANDTDAESDPLTAVLVTNVIHGSLTLYSDGSFSYTPTGNYNGPDSFTYKANDGWFDSASNATVSITVDPVNDAPVGVADSYSMYQGNTLVVAVPGVLSNDTDIDLQVLSVQSPRPVSGPSNGSLGLNADGSFSYTPTAGFTGVDTFTYKATDGTADSLAATVTITVTSTAYVSSSAWTSSFSATRYLDFTFPAYLPSGATVTSATFRHSYRSYAGGTTCYYFEVWSGGTLIGSHGTSGAPLSCNSASSYATDTVSLPEVNTAARANAVTVRLFVRNSASGKSEHNLATLGVQYWLGGP